MPSVTVVGETSVSVSVAASTSVSVVASGGIGPAGFITVPGTATLAFGTFQFVPGDGITVSTADGQFLISSYPSTTVSSLAPVQSVAGRTGNVVLQASDVTAGTFAIGLIPTIGYTALSGVPTAFQPVTHTHDAGDVAAGVLSIGRIPTISYTALSNVPSTFAPSAHTHSTTDVVSFTPAAAAAAPVQSVQSRTGSVVLTREDLTAAAAVHTHSTADIVGLTASFSQVGHTHAAGDVTSGTFDIARIPTIGYTALSGVPGTFTPAAHTHGTTDIVAFTAAASSAAPVQSVAGRTGAISLAAADVAGLASVATSGSYTSLDSIPLTFAPATHTHAASDIQSGILDHARLPTISYTALASVPATFVPSGHTHSTTDVVGLSATFATLGHTHSAGDITSGTLDHARIPTISFTALSNTSHTHSTSDISGYQGLPAQAGYAGPLVTDGTNATWTSRYSIVSPVLVQGAGMTFTRDTAAGEITIAFAGGTSGIVVGSATPQPLGVAAAGSSANASREDHVHTLPTVGDITAASATHTHAASDVQSGTFDYARIPTIPYTGLSGVPVTFAPETHTHSASDVTSGTFDIARIPTIGYTALSGVPLTFAPASHTHDAADIASGTIASARLPSFVSSVNGLTGTLTIASGSNVTVSTAGSTITIAAGGGGGGASPAARSLHFVFRG